MKIEPFALQLKPKRVAWILAGMAGCVVLAHLAVIYAKFFLGRPYMYGIVPLFDLDQERNVPALFSTMLFLLDGGLLFAVAHQKKTAGRPHKRWVFRAGLFCFLGIDEFVSVHEQVGLLVGAFVKVGGVFTFAWVIPYAVGVVLLAIWVLPLLRTLDRGTLIRFILSALVFLSGAMGIEMASGPHFAAAQKTKDLGFALYTTFEEPLEMAGLILFAHSLLSLLRKNGGFEMRVLMSAAGENERSVR